SQREGCLDQDGLVQRCVVLERIDRTIKFPSPLEALKGGGGFQRSGLFHSIGSRSIQIPDPTAPGWLVPRERRRPPPYFTDTATARNGSGLVPFFAGSNRTSGCPSRAP